MKPFHQKILYLSLILYFFAGFFVQRHALLIFFYFVFPIVFLFLLLHFLKRQLNKTLLLQLQSLLSPLAAQMSLGSSFMTAWHKVIEDPKLQYFRKDILEITKALKFNAEINCVDIRREHLVRDLIEVKNNPQPSKRLKHLKQKIKTELAFEQKSARILFQLKMQSYVITLFYLCLLVWVIVSSGIKHFSLILISIWCFLIGFIWILTLGRRMKWTL